MGQKITTLKALLKTLEIKEYALYIFLPGLTIREDPSTRIVEESVVSQYVNHNNMNLELIQFRVNHDTSFQSY
ncbi:hypothetical protein A3752_07765 [Oleiphilus sp. HI0081]|uniref:hypothetical protein n=2 Tax=Oleiphilus TaxID=141450 RepID=UPI0007C20E90|nr:MULTISPECIES: hypothetical protein [unclassified Oleiphilus]KZZ21934.1 hypothetical protein A3752_07765 [Oleiphilus sp. HI0081]